MYIKTTIVSTKKKTYRYVKLIQAKWSPTGAQEKVIATLGTVEDVIKSRETIIRGLQALSVLSREHQKKIDRLGKSRSTLSRQKKGGRRRRQPDRSGFQEHQTKTLISSAGRRQGIQTGSRGKKNKKRRSRR